MVKTFTNALEAIAYWLKTRGVMFHNKAKGLYVVISR